MMNIGLSISATHPAAASGSFSPDDVSGLELWFDATDAATITSNVGVQTWADKSSAGNDLTQLANSAHEPALAAAEINGLNAVKSDATDDHMDITSAVNDSGWLFYAAQLSAAKSAHCIVSGVIAHMQSGNATSAHSNITVGSVYVDGSTLADQTRGTLYTACVDGSPHVTCIQATAGMAAAFTTLFIPTAFFNANGSVGEILYYNATPSTAEINQIGNYLADKWGATWNDIL